MATLQLRLDALNELLESPHLALEAAGLLEQLPPQLDKMCANLAITRQRPAGAPSASKDPTVKVTNSGGLGASEHSNPHLQLQPG